MLDYIVHLGLMLDLLIVIAQALPLSKVWAMLFIFMFLDAIVSFYNYFDWNKHIS